MSEPVEINGVDVRSETLPGMDGDEMMPVQEDDSWGEERPVYGTVVVVGKGTELVVEVYPGKMGSEPWKGAGPGFFAGGQYLRRDEEGKKWTSLRLYDEPRMEKFGAPDPKAPRSPVELAVQRHRNLAPHIERFLQRLRAWRFDDADRQVRHLTLVLAVENTVSNLGDHLNKLAGMKATPKVTPASRKAAWCRAGAEVALRKDIHAKFLAFPPYDEDTLANLTIRELHGRDAFLVSGEREVGLVPVAHLVQRGK